MKNLRDDDAIMVGSRKVTQTQDVIVNGIDLISNVVYLYKMMNYRDVVIALPISKLSTPHNLASLNFYGLWLLC